MSDTSYFMPPISSYIKSELITEYLIIPQDHVASKALERGVTISLHKPSAAVNKIKCTWNWKHHRQLQDYVSGCLLQQVVQSERL